MSLVRIGDAPEKYDTKDCAHLEHYPPMMINLEPGVYQYTCPGCGYSTRFTIYKDSITWTGRPGSSIKTEI